MPVNHTSSLDKLLDYMPDLIEKTNNMMNTHIKNKKEETQTILQQMQKNSKKNKNEKSHENKDVKHEENKVNADINKKYNDQDSDIDYEFEYDETLEDE